CHKKAILEPLIRLMTPYAPHISEYIGQQLGYKNSITKATFPEYDNQYLVENSKLYPIAINGKSRTQIEFPLDATQEFIESEVMKNETVQKWIQDKSVK